MEKERISGIRTAYSLLGIGIIVLLAGCADAVNVKLLLTSEDPAGFLSGLWHGIIAPISFFGSLFSDKIAIYAVNNTGGWYDFGFVIGAGILFGGGGRASRRH